VLEEKVESLRRARITACKAGLSRPHLWARLSSAMRECAQATLTYRNALIAAGDNKNSRPGRSARS